MKRWALRISVFFLLGAIVNVAVAWACALFIDVDSGYRDRIRVPLYSQGWDGVADCRWRAGAVRIIRYPEALGSTWLKRTGNWDHTPAWADVSQPASMLAFVVADGRGWPFTSLASNIVIEARRDLPHWSNWWYRADTFGSGILLSSGDVDGYWRAHEMAYCASILPCWPVPAGAVANTLFYATVLWMLFAAPFRLRALRRQMLKRGLCPNCAYDLRGSAPNTSVCPECGSHR